MPCESYKQALTKTAAGAPASPALRSHLIVCASCRATLAAVESLFASLDAGLRIVSNTEIPGSLVPGVRSRLSEPVPQKRWLVPVLAPLVAGILMTVFLVHRPPRRAARPHVAASPRATASVVPPIGRPALPLVRSSSPEVSFGSDRSLGVHVVRQIFAPIFEKTAATSETLPEIIVQPGQEALLVRYVEDHDGRRVIRLTAELFPRTPLEPIALTPIQIDVLDVQSLAEPESR